MFSAFPPDAIKRAARAGGNPGPTGILAVVDNHVRFRALERWCLRDTELWRQDGAGRAVGEKTSSSNHDDSSTWMSGIIPIVRIDGALPATIDKGVARRRA